MTEQVFNTLKEKIVRFSLKQLKGWTKLSIRTLQRVRQAKSFKHYRQLAGHK